MIGTRLTRALVITAMTLAAPAAYADPPSKPEKKADEKKADEKKGDEKKGNEHAAKKAKQHEEQKAKLAALLKTAPDDAIRQELRRHAERVARLERIKTVASEAKDNDSAERANKLLAKENERHDKWMSKHVEPTTTTTTTGGAK